MRKTLEKLKTKLNRKNIFMTILVACVVILVGASFFGTPA